MNIRQEMPTDYDAVYQVVKEAFANAEYTDGDEQNLVVRLRKSKSFVPELSLVAVEDEKIVGHILFTRAVVNGIEGLALAPLSVLPEYQNIILNQVMFLQVNMGLRHPLKLKMKVLWQYASMTPWVT